MTKPKFLFYYRRTGKYALNVLAGTLLNFARNHQIPLEIDFPKSFSELKNAVARHNNDLQPCIVLWSFYSADFPKMTAELKSLKADIGNDSITHIAGGVHTSANPKQTLSAGFDFVAVGEGEKIIEEICQRLAHKQSLKSVKGLAYLENERMVRNGKGDFIQLDDYPTCCPEYKKFGPIEITRGCIFACQFCQTPFVNKARFRH